MSSFGVTSTGFVAKSVQDILDDVETGERAAFGSTIDVSAESPLGQINGVIGGALAEAWELAQAVYSAQYPGSSSGAALDNVASITGSVRTAATRGTVLQTCTGDPGTVLALGRIVERDTTAERWISLASDTLVAVAAWAASTAYVVGDRVNNSGNVYQCTTAGTSASSGGPTSTDPDEAIVDGTVIWRWLGAGTAAVDITFRAEQFGSIVAPSGSLNVITTPVSGWDGAINVLDASTGIDLETDALFRQRREFELATSGSATIDAIRADLLNVNDVLEAFVFENVSEFAGPDGEPPHSIECVVRTTTGDTPDDDIDQAVADQILASKATGIETFGFGTPPQFVTKTSVDSQGTAHTIEWTRVEDVEIWIEIDITTDPDVYPLDGDDQIKAVLVADGEALIVGETVIAEKNKAQAFDVSGVVDITGYRIGTAPGPTLDDNIPISNRQAADFDTSRVTVASV